MSLWTIFSLFKQPVNEELDELHVISKPLILFNWQILGYFEESNL